MNFEVTIKDRKQLTELFYLFISKFRKYAISKLNDDGQWEVLFRELLTENQKKSWDRHLSSVYNSENLIDFTHLGQFVRSKRSVLLDEIIPQKHSLVYQLPSFFIELNELRNQWAHFQEMDKIQYHRQVTIIHDVAEYLLKDDDITGLAEKMIGLSRPQIPSPSPDPLPLVGEGHLPPDRVGIINYFDLKFFKSKGLIRLSNFHYANIYLDQHWWIDVPPRRLSKDLYLGLINREMGEIHLIKIVAHTLTSDADLFEVNSKGYFKLFISASTTTKFLELRQKKFDFSPHHYGSKSIPK